MKTLFIKFLTAVILLSIPTLMFAQAPPLGSAANFVLFTTVGAVGNAGISQVTGNVGTNSGAITGFGNVNGVMHTSDGTTGQCAADLLIAYNLLNSTVATFFPAPLLGNGQILNAGVYSLSGASTLNGILTLDAQGNGSAVFIFKIQGPFSTAANSKVKLINGALACNVFWKIEGLVSMASATVMRGTIIANNAAINLSTGDTLEGRALSTTGAVNVLGVLAYTPIGCGSPLLTGPAAPALGTTQCYGLFSTDGPVSNAGITHVTGDVGTNVGLTTGFNPLFVTGMIHPIPDVSTSQCAADLGIVYTYLNTLPYDIELLYPAQFGHNLVLTPHTYLMNAATTFTDTLYLNAMGNADAVFVIKINGALTTSTYSKVVLINGTLAKNVYWKVDGAVSINDYSLFKGTIVANNAAILLATGVNLEGRALTTTGALGTTAITATMPPGCGGSAAPLITTQPVNQTACEGSSVSFSVTATGTALTYQWRIGTVNLTNGGNIYGATSSTLTFNPVKVTNAALNYNVVINGTYLPDVTSNNASLVVNATPVPFINAGNTPCANNIPVDYYTEAGMTNYVWTVTTGGTITAGQGTSEILAGWNAPGPGTVTVNYSSIAGCPSAGPAIFPISVNNSPSAAGPVTGTATVCTGANGIAYSVAPISFATSYVWILPVGASIATGAGTNNITVDFSASALSGNVSAAGNNICGNGLFSVNFPVTVNGLPEAAGAITGPASVCSPSTGNIYAVPLVTNATSYIWSLPVGATITSGANSNTITVSYSASAYSGNLSVFGSDLCGNGQASTAYSVGVNSVPIAPVVTVDNDMLTSSAAIGNQWYFEGNLIPGATNQTYQATQSGRYTTIVTLNGCSSGASVSVNVVMTGIGEQHGTSIQIFPVPNDGMFRVSITSPTRDTFTIQVFNNLGVIISETDKIEVKGTVEKSIDLRPAANGIYIVMVKSSTTHLLRRVIINN